MASLDPSLYAPKIANATDRGDARYSIAGLQNIGNNTYRDAAGYTYDSNGLALGLRPDAYTFTPGIGSASDSASYNVETGTYGASGGGGGGGSFGPQFDQMMQDLKAQGVADKASRDAAIQRSFINFGLGNVDLAKAGATTGIADLASILNPTTQQLAANNQFSVQKRLDQALSDRKIADRVALRQRGAARSGEAGYAAQNTQRAYDTDEYDATQKLLDYITGAQQGFVEAERNRQMQLWQMALAAAQAGGYGGYGGGGGDGGGVAAPTANLGPPPVPGFAHAGIGNQIQVNPQTGGGYAINTGGGYYTNRNNDLTSKWLKLAGVA